MLKSIDFMKRLEKDLSKNVASNNINNFFIELRINQKIDIYVVSDQTKHVIDIEFNDIEPNELENRNLLFTFLTNEESQDDDYRSLFENEKVGEVV